MLTPTRATVTADAVATVADKMTKLLEDINKVLEYNSDQNIAWTPATKVFTAANATEIFTSNGHGLLNGQKARVTNSGGALPAGLSAGVDYFLTAVAANTFQLSLTVGGAAVLISTDGTGVHTLNPVPDYITEEANGNISSRSYDRVQISNAIGSLTQVRNCLLNQVVTQGDHLGNLNQVGNPL